MFETNLKKRRIGKIQKDAFSFFKCLKKKVILFCLVSEVKQALVDLSYSGRDFWPRFVQVKQASLECSRRIFVEKGFC